MIQRGYGRFRQDLGGAEEQAMHGTLGKLFGKYTEEMFFEGDQSALNPMRYIPTPFHTKFAQERTALSQYTQQEAIGTRMRRWERPVHDFLAPYLRGAIARVTGGDVIPQEVEHRRDPDTMADQLTGLTRSLPAAAYKTRPRARVRGQAPHQSARLRPPALPSGPGRPSNRPSVQRSSPSIYTARCPGMRLGRNSGRDQSPTSLRLLRRFYPALVEI